MTNLLGWCGNIALLVGAILIAYKKKVGFLVNVVGLTFHVFVGRLMKINFLVACDFIFVCVCVWSYRKWRKGEENGN